MDLLLEITILLELIIAAEILKMLVPLRVAVQLQIAHPIGVLFFEDVNSTCSMSPRDEYSIGRGMDDVAVEHPDRCWLQHGGSDMRRSQPTNDPNPNKSAG